MNDNNHRPVADMFAREDQEKNPYDINAFSSTYTILPGVFSPKVRNNSLWYATKVIPLLSGNSFLEIGAGAGVLATEVAKRGYAVVATDIDPQAIKNIELNANKHKAVVDARQGDVFAPLKKGERFDNIFWNHPWVYSETEVDNRHRVSFDYHYQSLKKFINQGKNHLTKSGQILLGSGSLARLDLITDWAREAGFKLKLECRETQPLMVNGDTSAEFLIYSLRV